MRRNARLLLRRGASGRKANRARRRGLLLSVAAAALALSGCAPVGPPQVTFYADGHTVDAKPVVSCDALARNCSKAPNAEVSLKIRPGKPVQVSVPSAIGDTPWLVITQYANPDGTLDAKQQYFGPKTRLAYTATPGTPNGQIVVVEVQQLGAAFAADAAGNPILDEDGNPQLVARAYWSLQVQPG